MVPGNTKLALAWRFQARLHDLSYPVHFNFLDLTAQVFPPMAELTRHGYPPALTSDQTEYLLSTIRDWALANGLAVRPPSSDPSTPLTVTAPVTLFPSPFPRECFQEVRAIQTLYNELYALIARDEDWLKGIVEE